MSAAWAAVLVSIFLGLGAVGRELVSSGRRGGKVDACLTQLTKIVGDHEDRIRLLEAGAHQVPAAPRP